MSELSSGLYREMQSCKVLPAPSEGYRTEHVDHLMLTDNRVAVCAQDCLDKTLNVMGEQKSHYIFRIAIVDLTNSRLEKLPEGCKTWGAIVNIGMRRCCFSLNGDGKIDVGVSGSVFVNEAVWENLREPNAPLQFEEKSIALAQFDPESWVWTKLDEETEVAQEPKAGSDERFRIQANTRDLMEYLPVLPALENRMARKYDNGQIVGTGSDGAEGPVMLYAKRDFADLASQDEALVEVKREETAVIDAIKREDQQQAAGKRKRE